MAVLLTALAGYLLIHRLQTDSVQSVQQSIDGWWTTLTTIRWTMISIVALSWNHTIVWLADAAIMSSAKAIQLTELRWRAVTWLALLELALGQEVLVKAVSLALGAVP